MRINFYEGLIGLLVPLLFKKSLTQFGIFCSNFEILSFRYQFIVKLGSFETKPDQNWDKTFTKISSLKTNKNNKFNKLVEPWFKTKKKYTKENKIKCIFYILLYYSVLKNDSNDCYKNLSTIFTLI